MEHSELFRLDQHAIPVTFFPDQYASRKDEETWTLPELAGEIRDRSEARKDLLPWLKLARFGEERSAKNCLRTNANTQEVTGGEIDYDAGTMRFDAAVAAMKKANIRCLLYTSASHVEGVKEKWRVLVPFSTGYPPKQRAEMVAVVNGILGGVAAAESFVLSTAFYYGCVNHNPGHRVEVVDGDFVDLRPDLFQQRKYCEKKKKAGNGHDKTAAPPGVAPGRDEAEILALIAESRRKNPHGGGQWHNSMLSATASMIGKGWTDAEIYDACEPYCDGHWGDEEIAEMIESGRAKWKKPDPDKVHADIGPIVAQATAAKGGVEHEFEPNWLERYVNGRPKASVQNALIALEARGVRCAEDVFHNKIFIHCDRSSARAPFTGEVTDGGILSLRGWLLEHYRFDLTEKHVRDAIIMMARENRFNPVTDMLEEAEANWDGVERLDRMAADYFNCEDTELNSACVRKTMVAAVARARRPGCKFDNILVMESPEGWNKSSVWAVLAGEGNFSDVSIIGHGVREVQEQLAGIWIHESADLAGMKKAEVETVKAFASRQVDRARPAYGHFLVEQPRHSIEVGTTNSDKYLQSPTGNRRFWSMRLVAAIDLDKVKAERLQLWGEAAHYQSHGESLVLDRALWDAAGAEQEERRIQHPWESLIDGMTPGCGAPTGDVGIIHRVRGEDRVLTADIFTYVIKLAGHQMHRGHAINLQEIMVRKGWTHKTGVRIGERQGAGYIRNGMDNGI